MLYKSDLKTQGNLIILNVKGQPLYCVCPVLYGTCKLKKLVFILYNQCMN